MNSVDIERVTLHWWKVSVDRKKRDAIMATLRENKLVCLAKPWDDQVEVISLYISNRSQHSEREELAKLIRRLADGEPEKPERHPILDQKWSLSETKRLLDSDGSHISYSSKYNSLLVHVPHLLRELERHLITGTNWSNVCTVMARMGLAGE